MKNAFTKALAIAGALLVWFPILWAFSFSMDRLITRGELLDDFAYALQFFPLALVGGLLLIWSASRARSRLKTIRGSYLLGVATVIGGLTLASIFGLDPDVIRPGSYWIAYLSVGFFVLATMVVAVSGLLLLRDLFSQPGNDRRA